MKYVMILSALAVMIYACKSAKKNASDGPVKDIDGWVLETYGENYEALKNETGEYALILAYMKTRPNDIFPTLDYKLLRLDSMKIEYEEIVPKATASWISDYIFEVKVEPGIPGPDGRTPKDMSYKYDVLKAVKFSGSFFKNKQN